jgi:enterochelin esterase-like enzyme
MGLPVAAAGVVGGAVWAGGSHHPAPADTAPADTAPADTAPAVGGTSPAAPTSQPAAPATSSGPVVIPRGPAQVTPVRFHSAARGRDVSMAVVSPVSGPPLSSAVNLPVCLVLHGRGDDARGAVALLGLDAALADAARAGAGGGAGPFVAVTVDGGETYWHPRASGDDPERMILDEVLPRLAAQGLRTTRLAVLGWSMGGYGALLLARRHPGLAVAVAASSPAMWHSYGASAPGAFDSAADFTAHRVLGMPPVPGVAYRIDCGTGDPFYQVSREVAGDLVAGERGFGPGGHTAAFWRAALPAQLAFVGRALAAQPR